MTTNEKNNRNSNEVESLREELQSFRTEKEKIRSIIGQIGGANTKQQDRLLNLAFIVLLLALVSVDVSRYFLGEGLDWLPPIVSLEVGLLLISLKIIWMIHKQTKVEHFQFWILNSIEFRLNEIAKKITTLEKAIGNHAPGKKQQSTDYTD